MDRKRRKNDLKTSSQRCQCGWVGSPKQLAIWLRKDQIVSRICPRCGTPSPLRQSATFRGRPSQMLH